MVKFIALSPSTELHNEADLSLGNFWNDVFRGTFTLVGMPAATVTPTNVSIFLAPVTISMTGKFHTDFPHVPPNFTNPIYTGTVKSIIGALNGTPTYKLTGLDLPLTEIRNSGSSLNTGDSARDANVLMAEIFRGADKIVGSEVSDDVSGYAGPDILLGKGGADELQGDGGRDLLDGGFADDVLLGGNGKDIYRFSTALGPQSNVDVISDFEHRDQIQLSHHVFTRLGSSGHLAAGNFVIGPVALDRNDFIIYDNGRAYYDADGDGSGAAVQFAAIFGFSRAPAVLSHNDFDLI